MTLKKKKKRKNSNPNHSRFFFVIFHWKPNCHPKSLKLIQFLYSTDKITLGKRGFLPLTHTTPGSINFTGELNERYWHKVENLQRTDSNFNTGFMCEWLQKLDENWENLWKLKWEWSNLSKIWHATKSSPSLISLCCVLILNHFSVHQNLVRCMFTRNQQVKYKRHTKKWEREPCIPYYKIDVFIQGLVWMGR